MKITKVDKIQVQELYNCLEPISDYERNTNKDYIMKPYLDIETNSVNNGLVCESKNIPYIMKHKVKKRMFKITCNGDDVTITEDHSLMILRNGQLTEIKPTEIKHDDKLIKFSYDKNNIEYFDNFEMEDLGIQEEWVYDIEVENNHNFFGNNILVHNSVYFHIEPFVNMYMKKNPGLPINDYVDWADSFETKVIKPLIEQCIDDFSEELNAYNKDLIGAEREIISDAAVFSAKKKYFARVRDSEGTRFPENEPYIKVMGLEVAKSSTPVWSKKMLKASIPHILDKDENDLKLWLKDIKQQFTSQPIPDISIVGGVSNLDYTLGQKGVPIGSRSALVHNEYIIKNKLENQYTLIQAGDKCKRVFLIEPNPLNSNVVSYTNDSFVDEFKDYIDYDTQFEKGFQSSLNIMVESLKYNLNKETNSLDDW